MWCFDLFTKKQVVPKQSNIEGVDIVYPNVSFDRMIRLNFIKFRGSAKPQYYNVFLAIHKEITTLKNDIEELKKENKQLRNELNKAQSYFINNC